MNPYELSVQELTDEIERDKQKVSQLRAEADARQRQLDGKVIAREVLQRYLSHPVADTRAVHSRVGDAAARLAQAVPLPSESKWRVVDQIKKAIESMGNMPFTVREIESRLEEQGNAISGVQPRARISAFLKDLTVENYVTLVREGSGGIPNTYKLTSQMTESELRAIKNPSPLMTGLGS